MLNDDEKTRWDGYANGWSAIRFPEGWLVLRPSERGEALADDRLEGLVVITAANPFSRVLPDEENEQRRQSLRRRLGSLGVENPLETIGGFPGIGGSEQEPESWPGGERGFAAVLSREEASLLAKEFEQEAIYAFTKGRRVLLSTEDLPAVETFYRPADGLHS